MASFSASIDVDAPAADVFGVVSDLTTHPGWAKDDLTVEKTGDQMWRSSSLAKGRTFLADLLVTANEPDRCFEFVSSDETGTYRHRFVLDSAPGGCRVTRTVTAERLGFGQQLLYWVTLVPVRRPALRESLRRLAESFR